MLFLQHLECFKTFVSLVLKWMNLALLLDNEYYLLLFKYPKKILAWL